MRREVENINPLDTDPDKAIGIQVPFNVDSVFKSTYTTKEALKVNMINYLLTAQGERYYNPTFGTPIREQLFENITESSIESLKNIIRQGISIYFPKVKIDKIEIIGVPDENLINLQMSFAVVNTNIEDELVINFEQ